MNRTGVDGKHPLTYLFPLFYNNQVNAVFYWKGSSTDRTLELAKLLRAGILRHIHFYVA